MAELIEQAEKRFQNLLIEINKPLEAQINSSIHEKLSNDLKDAFRSLIELYIRKNDWTKFFTLVDFVEKFVNKSVKPNIENYHLDELLRLIADVFYSVRYKTTAFEYYKKSIRLSDETNLIAFESLENLIDECMERWHYRMINDSVRNQGYSMAIFKRLDRLNQELGGRQIRVLDIGSGTGLLGAICLSNSCNFTSGKIRIYACEENEFFYDISRRFLNSIDHSNRITVVNKNSMDLVLKEDLDGEKIDLIVTEIFDDGLLGEGCLSTLYDALYVKKLVRSSNVSSRLITESARVFICGVESARLRRSSRYSSSFGSSGFRVDARCLNNSERFEKEFESCELNLEPYTSENLNNYEDVEILSLAEEIVEFRIRFDDEKLLERLCVLKETLKTKKHLKAIRSGTLDAIVFWFELYLDDEVVLTNCPTFIKKSKNAKICHCWDQAVYNVSKPFSVTEGQLIGVDCKLRGDCFMFNVEKNKENGLLLWLSEFELRLLNHRPYQEFFTKWFDNEMDSMPKFDEPRDLTAGYLSNTFSEIFFDLVLKYKPVMAMKNVNLKIELFTSFDHEFGKYLATTVEEKFPFVKIHYLDHINTAQQYNLDYLIYEPHDVKFGVLKKNLISELVLIKSCNSKKDFKLFPQSITLKSTVIESDSLLKDSQLVSNKNLCIDKFSNVDKIDLEPFLTDYYTPQQYSLSINYNTANYKQLSEPTQIMDLKINNLEIIDCNEGYFETKVVQSGRSDFVLYWYELTGLDGRSYSPFSIESERFWGQLVAFSMFGKQVDIDSNRDQIVKIKFLFKNQFFFIKSLSPSSV